jgi:hypothetical protein
LQEITKLKTIIGSSSIDEEADLNDQIKPKSPKPGATGSLLMMHLSSN